MRNLFRALVRSSGDGIFGKAMSAGFWAAALRVSLRLLILLRTIILARLLAPDDFGLMAVATLSVALMERFTQSGFEAALVQKDDDIKPYLNSAWTLAVVRGFGIAAVLILAAPWIAQFFDAPEATSIIRVLAIAVIIRSFQNIATVYFTRDLRFDKYFVLQISEKGVDIVISIALAIIYQSVWALVFGVLFGSIAKTIVSWLIVEFRPRFRWVQGQISELFHFGKWILGQNILGWLSGNIDDIMVGRLLGTEQLGLYRMAYNFSQAMATEITQVTNQVSFPAYSRLQGALGRLRLAYFGSLHLVSFLGMPLAVGTILVAPDFVIGVLGDKWEPIIVSLQLLSVAGLVRGLGATVGPLLQSQNRPDIPPRFSLANLTLVAIGLYPAITMYGIEGAAGVVAIAGTITGSTAVWVAFRYLGSDEPQAMQSMGYPAINTVVMAGAILLAKLLPIPQPTLLSFLIFVAVGIAAYFASVLVMARYTSYNAPSELIKRVRDAAA